MDGDWPTDFKSGDIFNYAIGPKQTNFQEKNHWTCRGMSQTLDIKLHKKLFSMKYPTFKGFQN